MATIQRSVVALLTLLPVLNALSQDVASDLARIGSKRGIVAIIGAPDNPEDLVALTKSSKLTVVCQVADRATANDLRLRASQAGMLGERIFITQGPLSNIHLATNIADCILVQKSAKGQATDAELLRSLRPLANAYVGTRKLTKPVPQGVDDWSHPYHGPDNNPQSEDKLVRGNFHTQFLGFPMFSPMPEQTVIANGRIYKAMGHIAHKVNQNEMLNTLMCINAYNGTVLWRRPLPKGFMIHRNTMIATDDGLWMGDYESCKFIDGRNGQVTEQISIPKEITDGPVWKWMALKDGVLYGLVGNLEVSVDTQKAVRRGLGHWPWGMWKGHDYKDPRTSFGFGRTLVAIDLKSKQILWHHRDEEFLDARAMCMNDKSIFCYSPASTATKHKGFLLSIDRKSGKPSWRNSDKPLMEAISPNNRAQHYITGYATTCYMKCTSDYLFFAGPQRVRMVVASARDGKLAWTYPVGNLQLVLREDGVWAAGPQRSKNGMRFEYATGKVLAEFPARRACTRATGCADSIFFRASGGTVRVLTDSTTAQHISPMRPPCQDGVLIAGGHLYWGPWMCGCQLSLYGNIGLAPQATSNAGSAKPQPPRLVGENIEQVEKFVTHDDDWPTYRGQAARTDVASVSVPENITLSWQTPVSSKALPTGPVAAGGRVFIADRSGAVTSLDDKGEVIWKTFTGGPVYFPPVVANDRVYVGSADGRVYAFAATDGRFLWSFRVAPRDRLIPVYGKMISTWPVSGGVAVKGETVYAAAGIAHYDGTHVVALDAITGELKARNDSSGVLSPQVNSGISMQGNLSIVDNELRFLAGGVYEVARYDLATLKCLNQPKAQVNSQYRTAFYPFYPSYAKYLSLDHTLGNGCTLSHDASYEGSKFTNLTLFEALPPGTKRPRKEAARWLQRRGGKVPKKIWEDKQNRRFTAFVIGPKTLLATGHPAAKPSASFLMATDTETGADRWVRELSADVVKGGIAIDHQHRIYVSLENGKLLCFAPEKKQATDAQPDK